MRNPPIPKTGPDPEPAAEWVLERAAGLCLPRHHSWRRLVLRDPAGPNHGRNHVDLALAHPPVGPDEFRPSVVVRRLTPHRTITQASSLALAATPVMFPGTLLIANELWNTHGGSGRRQIFSYPAGPHTVAAHRWLLDFGPAAYELTASFSVEQSTGMEPLALYMASGAQLAGPEPAKDGTPQ